MTTCWLACYCWCASECIGFLLSALEICCLTSSGKLLIMSLWNKDSCLRKCSIMCSTVEKCILSVVYMWKIKLRVGRLGSFAFFYFQIVSMMVPLHYNSIWTTCEGFGCFCIALWDNYKQYLLFFILIIDVLGKIWWDSQIHDFIDVYVYNYLKLTLNGAKPQTIK